MAGDSFVATEIEDKFLATPHELELLARPGALGDLNVGTVREIHQHDTYFDTPDGQLEAGGTSLRLRRRGDGRELTLKQGGAAAGRFERTEATREISGTEAAAALSEGLAADALTGLSAASRGLPVHPVIELDTSRWLYLVGGGVEMALDRVVAARAGRRVGLCEIELESGNPELLADVSRWLDARFRLRRATRSKYARAAAVHRALEGARWEQTAGEAEVCLAVGTQDDAEVLGAVLRRRLFDVLRNAGAGPGPRVGWRVEGGALILTVAAGSGLAPAQAWTAALAAPW